MMRLSEQMRKDAEEKRQRFIQEFEQKKRLQARTLENFHDPNSNVRSHSSNITIRQE